jgi:hypothetical protein
MKTGIELIAQERQEQIEKHGRTLQHDSIHNKHHELRLGAIRIADVPSVRFNNPPNGWDPVIWEKMCDKSYTDRLIIAGALIAAEIDRINHSLK